MLLAEKLTKIRAGWAALLSIIHPLSIFKDLNFGHIADFAGHTFAIVVYPVAFWRLSGSQIVRYKRRGVLPRGYQAGVDIVVSDCLIFVSLIQ